MSPPRYSRASPRPGSSRGLRAVEHVLLAGLVVVVIIGGVSVLSARGGQPFAGGAVAVADPCPEGSPSCTAVASPPGIPALSASTHDGRARLTFAADDGGGVISGFVVERSDARRRLCDGPLKWSKVTRSGSSPFDTEFHGHGCWRVAAVNELGRGSWSKVVRHPN